MEGKTTTYTLSITRFCASPARLRATTARARPHQPHPPPPPRKSRNACARHQKHVFSHITLYYQRYIDLMPTPTCTHFRVCFVQPKSTNTEIKKCMCTPSKTCVFTHHPLSKRYIDLMPTPTCTHFRVCFVQPKSTNTEIKKRMCTPSKTGVCTHHPLSKPYRFNVAPNLYALPSRLYTSRVDLNHLPSTLYNFPTTNPKNKKPLQKSKQTRQTTNQPTNQPTFKKNGPNTKTQPTNRPTSIYKKKKT